MKLTMKNARLIYDMRVRDGETRCFESWLLHELETCVNQRDAVTAERDRAIVQLAQANEFVDRLGEFLLCVNQPHDYDCANYRDETKPCDCGYEELTKRFNEHRAHVERKKNKT